MINSFIVYNEQDEIIEAYSNPSIKFYRASGEIFVFEVENNKYNVLVEDDFRIQIDSPVCLSIKGNKDQNRYTLYFGQQNIINSIDFM